MFSFFNYYKLYVRLYFLFCTCIRYTLKYLCPDDTTNTKSDSRATTYPLKFASNVSKHRHNSEVKLFISKPKDKSSALLLAQFNCHENTPLHKTVQFDTLSLQQKFKLTPPLLPL